MGFFHSLLDVETLRARLEHDGAGGIAIFEGRVRNTHQGHPVLFLEYEAYQPLAQREMEGILREIRQSHGILRAIWAHRLGRVEKGEVAVWVGVAAVHRAEAFAACMETIRAIKHRLPIWKKEHYGDRDSRWIACSEESDGKGCGSTGARA